MLQVLKLIFGLRNKKLYIKMYCRCNNEFEWLMNMLKKGNCFSDWKDVAKFIDDRLL